MCVLLQRRSSVCRRDLPITHTWPATAGCRKGNEEFSAHPITEQTEKEEEKEKEGEKEIKSGLGNSGMPMFILPHPSIEEITDIICSCRRGKRNSVYTTIMSLHTYLCRIGLCAHSSVGNDLVSLLLEVGNVDGAQRLFDKLVYRNSSSWNSLITIYSNCGELRHAFNLFQKVQCDGTINVTPTTFVALLMACAKAQDLIKGMEVHTSVSNSQLLETDVFVGSMIVDMYAKCGALHLAQKTFNNIQGRDVVSWTALIGGYANHGKSQKALQCFEDMQNEGIFPNEVTFTCALKACVDERDLGKGIEMHAQIEKEGFSETHLIIGNALLNMYGKFDLLCEAQKVFDKLPNHDVITWTTLLSAYVAHGHGEEALKCLEEMRHENILPNAITYIWILKACASIGTIQESQRIHANIEKHGLGNDNLVGNTLIDMYAKFGFLQTAETMFEKLEKRGVVSWTTLIAEYTEHSQYENAMKCFQQMLIEGILPDAIALGFYLKACGNVGAANKCESLHAWIEAIRFSEEGHFIFSILIEIYCNLGMIVKAKGVLDRLEIRDEISLTPLMKGYLEHGCCEEAFTYFKQIQLEGATLDSSLFVCGLKACGSLKARVKGEEIHAEIEKKGWLEHKHVGNALVDMYVKCGSVVIARQVFDRLRIKDVVSWSTLISGYVDDGCHQEALRYFELMQEQSVFPNAVTFVSALKSCGNGRIMDQGCELHSQIEKIGLRETDIVVGTVLVDMYAKFGWLCEAHQVFEELPNADTVSWTALIMGYIEHGDSEKALMCLQQMQQIGIPSNSITLVCGLKACGILKIKGKGLEIHATIKRRGLLEKDVLIGNTMVDMYAKCGCLPKACQVFDELLVQDVTTWNCLIMGYIDHDLSQEALKCYEQMQTKCVIPNTVTFICCLKACGRLGALNKGLQVHAVIEKCGLLETDIIIGNTLIDMYVKCASLMKSQDVFHRLPFRDVVTWNVLIKAYIEHGLCGEALKCLKLMELEGVHPDSVTYVYSLKACGSTADVHNAQNLHAEINKNIFSENCASVGSALADIYVKFGLLSELQQVVHELPFQNIAMWNSLIFRYTEHGYFEQALQCSQQMQLEGVLPNAITLSYSLKACGSIRAINKGREIHSEIERKGLLQNDLVLGNGLVDMYAKCGSLSMAHQVFDLLPVRDVISWTALMAGYAEHGYINVAFECFEHMQLEAVSPNFITFLSSLKATSTVGVEAKSLEMHTDMEKMGLLEESLVGNILVSMYVKSGYLAIAQEMFQKLAIKDVVSWTALITGLAEQGKGEEALQCFEQMHVKGILPNTATLLGILKACGIVGDSNMCHEIHAEIERMGLLKKDIVVGTAVIDMYAKRGLLNKAQQVFNKLPVRDVVSWNALIGGYAEHGYGDKALELFDEMQHKGVSPSPVTFVCCLKACGSIGAKHKGQDIHAEIERKGLLENDLFIGNILVDMYGRCGLLTVAQHVSKKLSVRDVITWNSLLTGYSQLGAIEDVFYTFNQMVRAGIRPDCVSFLIVLSACTRSGFGFFEKFGSVYMESMSRDFGITATPQLHNAMVTLHCRAGQLDMAMSMLAKMPFSPDVVALHAVLDSCRSCGNAEVGKQAFEYVKRFQEGCQSTWLLSD